MLSGAQGDQVNFDLSEDEEMLKALTERFVADRYDLERRRGYQASRAGYSDENWALLAELGLISAPFAVEDGGAGLDATGIAVVFEALGRGLLVEPLIENGLLAGRLFAATAKGSLRDEWLGGVVGGQKRLAFAHIESGTRDDALWVETTAIGNGPVLLSGWKSTVAGGIDVDGFIVTARRSGKPADPDGVELWLVRSDAPGLSMHGWRAADDSAMASLTLDQVPAELLGGGLSALNDVLPMVSLARSAEAVGIMRRMLDETLEYLRTRQQFGVPLGNFQAIQHRMAAQYAALEQSRALLDLAVMSSGSDEFAAAVDGARAFIADASVTFGHEMIQFHGGMGVSDELSIGHAHKRLFFLSRWPESPEATLDRVAGVP